MQGAGGETLDQASTNSKISTRQKTARQQQSAGEFRVLVAAVIEFGRQTIFITPNIDAGTDSAVAQVWLRCVPLSVLFP